MERSNEMKSVETPKVVKPEFQLTKQNTIIFITGAPLSGKSTITPLVYSGIQGITYQSMDILRLVAQEIENSKNTAKKNPYVFSGSCESYKLIGNGEYSVERLIQGFNKYSKAVSSILFKRIIPNLDIQGDSNLLVEGVQLTPDIVAPFLKGNNKLIVFKSDAKTLSSNRKKLYGDGKLFLDRYSNEKLLAIQDEILSQAQKLPQEKVAIINTTSEAQDDASKIINWLRETKTIQSANPKEKKKSAKRSASHKMSIVMASDEKYISYLEIAIKSIRKHNASIPIKIFSCNPIGFLDSIEEQGVEKIQVKLPKDFRTHFDTISAYNHALTRIAKLNSITSTSESENVLYLDSDIIALTDVEKIANELKTQEDTVYLLLRRPQIVSLLDIGWLYFKNSSKMSPDELAQLTNDTFSTNYTGNSLLQLDCWNTGVIYGPSAAVQKLSKAWMKNYLQILTGKNKDSFIPNDQLSFWVTADQLKGSIHLKELPLSWNFMPGHAAEDLVKKPNPSPEEVQEALKDVNILHLAQNKTDVWAQILINDISSRK